MIVLRKNGPIRKKKGKTKKSEKPEKKVII